MFFCVYFWKALISRDEMWQSMYVFTVYVQQWLWLEGWKDPTFLVILYSINTAKQTNQKRTEVYNSVIASFEVISIKFCLSGINQ